MDPKSDAPNLTNPSPVPGAKDDEVERGPEELILQKQRHLHLAATAGKEPTAAAARRDREAAVEDKEVRTDTRSGFTTSTPSSHVGAAAAQEGRTTPHRRHVQP